MTSNNLVKVRLDLEDGDPLSGETLWAEQVADNLFRLDNVPFYAYGFALDDVVRCTQSEDSWQVQRLETDSGNGTIRILFGDQREHETDSVIGELESVGCIVERAWARYIAVSVPPTVQVPFSQLSRYLNSFDNDTVVGWEIGKNNSWMDQPG